MLFNIYFSDGEKQTAMCICHSEEDNKTQQSSDGNSNMRKTEWLHIRNALCSVKSKRMKTSRSVISNDAHLSCRLVPLLFFQHTGLWQCGHCSAMPGDPPQPRGLPRAVPEALSSLPVCGPAEWDPDGLREK